MTAVGSHRLPLVKTSRHLRCWRTKQGSRSDPIAMGAVAWQRRCHSGRETEAMGYSLQANEHFIAPQRARSPGRIITCRICVLLANESFCRHPGSQTFVSARERFTVKSPVGSDDSKSTTTAFSNLNLASRRLRDLLLGDLFRHDKPHLGRCLFCIALHEHWSRHCNLSLRIVLAADSADS